MGTLLYHRALIVPSGIVNCRSSEIWKGKDEFCDY
jgi:hypothetical protein